MIACDSSTESCYTTQGSQDHKKGKCLPKRERCCALGPTGFSSLFKKTRELNQTDTSVNQGTRPIQFSKEEEEWGEGGGGRVCCWRRHCDYVGTIS